MRDNFIVNAEWEPLPIHDLADSSLANWVHHVAHILPQVSGRHIVSFICEFPSSKSVSKKSK